MAARFHIASASIRVFLGQHFREEGPVDIAAGLDAFPPPIDSELCQAAVPGFDTTKALIAGQHKRERRRCLANFASNYCGKAYPIALSISMVRPTAGRAIIRS